MKTVYILLFSILGVGAVIGLYALVRMKLSIEKMVSLDVLTTLIAAVLLILALVSGKSFILDIAIIYAVLSFGAVLVVARHREGGV